MSSAWAASLASTRCRSPARRTATAAATRGNPLTRTAAEPVLLRIPFSHYCQKAEWALTQAGIPYETRDIWPWQVEPVYKVHPAGTVPVLRLGDALMCDSDEILTWVHEQRPEAGLYPTKQRKKIASWEAWANEELGALSRREAYRVCYHEPSKLPFPAHRRLLIRAGRPFILKILKFYKARRFDDSDAIDSPAALHKVGEQLRTSGGPFLFGKERTAADITVAALMVPLLWALEGRGLAGHPDAAACQAFVEAVRPARLSKTRSRKMGKRDWADWQSLQAA